MAIKLLIKISLIAGLFFPATLTYAQQASASSLFLEGEQLRVAYEFERAKEAYTRAISLSGDSAFIARAQQRRVLCENGLILSNYVVRPHVLGRTVIPYREFFLFYDLSPSGSWALPPFELLSHVNDKGDTRLPFFYRATQDRIVFSAKDSASGSGWDLYMIQKKDILANGAFLWGPPVRLGPGINTPGNEIYPVLSSDGKTLYFSSNGLPGLGGMNLYVSRWDTKTQEWGLAENLGIPFSSTHNDLLYMLSDDSRYFYFTSDRAAPKDSLVLYKVEYESAPVKIRPASVKELREIAMMPLSGNKTRDREYGPKEAGMAVPDSILEKTREATAHYTQLTAAVRNLKVQVAGHEKKLDSLRKYYSSLTPEEDRRAIANTIREEEFVLMELQQSLRDTRKSAQSIEDLFLSHGVLPPVTTPASKSPASSASGLQEMDLFPVKQQLISLDSHLFEAPLPVVPPVNLEFRIEQESVIVPWENEPPGLYYRIQLFTVARKATISQLKGISPIFEVRAGNHYVYYAGQFYNYADAARALASVKRRGITGAIVVAYFQGKSIPVLEGRRREAQNKTAPEGVAAFHVYLGSNQIPPALISLVGELSDKDIIRVITGSGTDYFIGPFASASQAEELASVLREKGFDTVTVQQVTN
ncbi:MAG TPA: hypothetical protein PLM86_00260 [Bacteroidales bacterium]|nr:hypothetical protein [Bacteroidales bacterium]OQB71527.1 MAG: WD40-like Beta Propeller Repeat protein [Bacteroidetes bacterium ADurb.Bin139]HOG24608.1 hypothetical protein [Bacteroidales bacterium]HOR11224.1 hypothetical protein [Bacteroidales bacterium]HOZ18912.1 hypothetical protein [Bacteroidales bacterium]